MVVVGLIGAGLDFEFTLRSQNACRGR